MRFWIFDFGFWIFGTRRPRVARASPTIQNRKSEIQNRPAFTLLEIILSLVILAAALAMLGEVMQLANRNATDARAETRAQLLATSIMDQIMAGAIDASNASRQAIEVDDTTPWVYSVTVGTSDIEGILPVEVLVEQNLEPQLNPVRHRLLRWLPEFPETPEGLEGGFGGGPGGAGPGGGSPGGPGPGGGGPQ